MSGKCNVAGTFSKRHMLDDDFEVIPTPGHTSGASAFLWDTGRHRFLFTGDTIYFQEGEWIATVLDRSDRGDYLESLELIRDLDGQTEGSVMLYRQRDGLLLTGDSAMGPTNPQTASDVERLIRPPVFTSADDAQLRRNWIEFAKPVAHLGPYHGSVYIGRGKAMEELMHPLVREEPTQGVEG